MYRGISGYVWPNVDVAMNANRSGAHDRMEERDLAFCSAEKIPRVGRHRCFLLAWSLEGYVDGGMKPRLYWARGTSGPRSPTLPPLPGLGTTLVVWG